MRRLPAESLLVGVVLLWSFNFTAMRYGVTHGFAPLSYAFLRWAVAGVALVAVAVLRGARLRVTRRELALLVGSAALGVFVNQTAYSNAARLAPASTVALVFGTLPVFVALIAQVFGVERLRPRHWAATCVSFTGVALVAAGAGSGVSGSLGGILLTLATAASFAGYSVATVPLMQRNSPLVVTAATSLLGAVMLGLAAIPALRDDDWGRIGGLGWSALAYSGLVSVVIGNLLWFTATERIGPSRASLFVNLQPFVGAVFAVLVLSESLSGLELAGGAVIASGIVLGRGGLTALLRGLRSPRAPSP